MATLPALPAGMKWVPDPVHGWAAVPDVAAAAPRPQAVVQTFAPAAATGYGPPPAAPPGRVIAMADYRGGDRLVRGLVDKDGTPQDPYARFLADVPDLAPGWAPSAEDAAAASTARATAGIPQPTALHELTEAHEDPSLDAFGGQNMQSSRLPTLAALAPGK